MRAMIPGRAGGYGSPIAWRLTIRTGPKVRKARFEELEAALDALEAACRRAPERVPVRSIGRDYAPAQQVALRAELRGPGGAGGVDVRGDGSAAAYAGRLVRRPLASGGDPYAALRSALSGSTSVEP